MKDRLVKALQGVDLDRLPVITTAEQSNEHGTGSSS
jgi:hypothetical protein